jgi:3D (Asp-Asp-Asp) domain-containing protein
MLLSRSIGRKLAVLAFGVLGFVLLYEVTIIDSERAARQAASRGETAEPAPGARLVFSATAYCKGAVTQSGVAPRTGIAAADPSLLPVGSVVQVGTAGEKYAGIYTIMDTGPAVRGREIDIYMWDCNEALRFGRQRVHLTVLRLGWNPRATPPGFIEVLFPQVSRRSAAPTARRLDSRPIIVGAPVPLPPAQPPAPAR